MSIQPTVRTSGSHRSSRVRYVERLCGNYSRFVGFQVLGCLGGIRPVFRLRCARFGLRVVLYGGRTLLEAFETMKEHSRAIFRVASEAQKEVDYIMDRNAKMIEVTVRSQWLFASWRDLGRGRFQYDLSAGNLKATHRQSRHFAQTDMKCP